MTLSLQILRDELRVNLGVDEDDVDDTQADRWLNLSWWELQDKVRFREKEGQVTFTTAAGVFEFVGTAVTADFESTEQLFIDDEDGNPSTLTYREHAHLLGKLDDTDEDLRGIPEEYSRIDNKIVLYPIPDGAYTLTLKYRKTLADIATGGVSIPQSWQEYILDGAIARGFKALGEYNRASEIKRDLQTRALTQTDIEGREKSDYRRAGLQLLQNRPR